MQGTLLRTTNICPEPSGISTPAYRKGKSFIEQRPIFKTNSRPSCSSETKVSPNGRLERVKRICCAPCFMNFRPRSPRGLSWRWPSTPTPRTSPSATTTATTRSRWRTQRCPTDCARRRPGRRRRRRERAERSTSAWAGTRSWTVSSTTTFLR